jgi:hypothetical protein
MSYPQEPPPYLQPQQPQKQAGISTGLKLAIGGCLILVILGGGFIVACGVWVKEVAKHLKDSNLSRTTDDSSPSSSTDTKLQRTLTLEKYDRITYAMEQKEVEEILGSKGKRVFEPTSNNHSKVTYTWQEGESATARTIRITFVNEKVQDKSQSGLE